MGAVRRVDVDQDRRRAWPSAYWAIVHSAQFGAQMPTRSPFPMPARDQPAGQVVDVAVQLGPGPAPAARELDQRLAVGMGRDGALEVGADGLLEQRRLRSLPRRRTPWQRTYAARRWSTLAQRCVRSTWYCTPLAYVVVSTRVSLTLSSASLGERAAAAAEDHREDHQPHLVDQAGLEQALGQQHAALHEDRAALGLLERRRPRRATRARWCCSTAGR